MHHSTGQNVLYGRDARYTLPQMTKSALLFFHLVGQYTDTTDSCRSRQVSLQNTEPVYRAM